MRKLFVDEKFGVIDIEQLQESLQEAIDNGSFEPATTLEQYIVNRKLEELTNKDILQIAEELELDNDQIAELLERVETEDDVDFELAGARIIHKDFIDKIQQEELLSDLYILGCFNANFLAGYLPISQSAIVAIQKAEAFEALGEICEKYIEEIQEGYATADGYGHHFNSYDSSEIETDHYYIFPRAAE